MSAGVDGGPAECCASVNIQIISAGADGGPRPWVCACFTLRSAPHQHQRKCFRAHAFFPKNPKQSTPWLAKVEH